MIGKKQNQTVDSEGTGIQAGRDVHITQNPGLSVNDVRELCREYLRTIYPTLLKEAPEDSRRKCGKIYGCTGGKIHRSIF